MPGSVTEVHIYRRKKGERRKKREGRKKGERRQSGEHRYYVKNPFMYIEDPCFQVNFNQLSKCIPTTRSILCISEFFWST